MTRLMLIDAADSQETRVIITHDGDIEHFDFVSKSKKQIKGNIYLGKVTRIEPSLQAAFVEYGGGKQGFLSFSEIHPDYYQIPVEDRKRLLEEAAQAEAEAEQIQEQTEAETDSESEKDEETKESRRNNRGRGGAKRRGRRKISGKNKAASPENESADASSGGESTNAEDDTTEIAAENIAATTAVPSTTDTPEETSLTAETTTDSKDNTPETTQALANETNLIAEETVEKASDDDEASEEISDNIEAFDDDSFESDATNDERSSDDDIKEEEEGSNDHKDASNIRDVEDDGDQIEDGETQANTLSDDDQEEDHEGDDATTDLSESQDDDDAVETIGDEGDDEEAREQLPLSRRYKIQEVIKPGQILLVQVVKEERGNKGVSLSTYISIAGRYCVLMPNSHKAGGISRKISNSDDRKRLREISEELKKLRGMNAIIRTAGIDRTRAEIKRDFEYLIKLWNQIREDALASIAPAEVYEENDIIKRSIRDHYDSDMENIYIEGETSYREAKDFMKMLMPSHAPRVKRHKDSEPIFTYHEVEHQLGELYHSTAAMKSGGYIVINPTEALISIDVNSGRSTNERNVEETAYKTNLEACEEIARQLRLRNLGGLVVVDFIDMAYHKYRRNVERALKEALRKDRAKIQVGRISTFGLLELSRQRMGASLVESTTRTCPTCQGHGRIPLTEATAMQLIRNLQCFIAEHGAGKITINASQAVLLSLMNEYREHITQLETDNDISLCFEISNAADASVYRIKGRSLRFDSTEGFTRKGGKGRRTRNNNRNKTGRSQPSKQNNTTTETASAQEEKNNETPENNKKTDRPNRRKKRTDNKRRNTSDTQEQAPASSAVADDKTVETKVENNPSEKKPEQTKEPVNKAAPEPHEEKQAPPPAVPEDTPAPTTKKKGWWQRVIDG